MTSWLNSPLLLAFLAAILVATVGFFLIYNQRQRKINVGSRLKALRHEYAGDEEEDETLVSTQQEKDPTAQSLQNFMESMGINVEDYNNKVRLRLIQAGIDSPNAPIYYTAARYIGLPLGLLVFFLLITTPAVGFMKYAYWMTGLITLVLALQGREIYIKNKRIKYAETLTRSFPDALDLILVCVESGLALDAALNRVCRELESVHPAITKELNRTRLELTLLNDRQRALQNLAERTDLMPFRALVGALLQSEKFGTSMTETLRVLSDDYRNTRLMIAENKAGRLPALMTIPLMLCMMPSFILIIMGPAIINVMKTFSK